MARLWYYEHYVDGRLAYVGITNNTAARRDEHAKDKPYFARPVTIQTVPFEPGTTRVQARAYETAQIDRLRPPFNNAGNPDYRHQGRQRSEICNGPVDMINRLDTALLTLNRLGRKLSLVLAGALAGSILSAVLIYT